MSNEKEGSNLKGLLAQAHLLQQLIATQSFSGDEGKTAKILIDFFRKQGITAERINNNVIIKSFGYNTELPTLLLCTHHDTVKPVSSYTRDPFLPVYQTDEEGRTRLYGLGSNDAGGSVVSMCGAFLKFWKDAQEGNTLSFNLLLALCGEEEISGAKGILSVLPEYPEISCAIVGEPTLMQAAIGERGLLVLDGYTKGKAGHAARNNGINALYMAIDDIQQLRHKEFDKVSEIMGHIAIQVTQIEAGTQHNVIPDACHYVVDVRTTDAYTNQEVVDTLQANLNGTLMPRNLRNRASVTPPTHALIDAIRKLRITPFISPTTSDWMRLSVPTLKIGPGDSPRSHSADEYIYLDEIEEGTRVYCQLIEALVLE